MWVGLPHVGSGRRVGCSDGASKPHLSPARTHPANQSEDGPAEQPRAVGAVGMTISFGPQDDGRGQVPPVIEPTGTPAAQPAATVAREQLRPPEPARGGWRRSPWLQGVAALALYLAGWLSTQARPLIAHPAWARLFPASMDPRFFTWTMRWWPYAIGHGLDPLTTTQLGLPTGQVLAWTTTAAPLGLVATPLTAIAGPVVSFNVLAALALPVSAWAGFVLCRRLTGRFWPALVGGLLFGFSGYEMNHIDAGQLDIVYSLVLPLIGYLAALWWEGAIGPRAFICLLAVALAVQFYLFMETFADLTGVLAIALLAGYVLAGRTDQSRVARLSRHVGLAYLGALVLAAPCLWVAMTHMPPRFTNLVSLDLGSLVLPRPDRTFGLAWVAHAAAGAAPESADGYLGLPLLLIAIVAAVSTWSSRLTRFLSVMLAFVVIAALGPVLHVGGATLFAFPWARLWSLPLLDNAFPARLMVFAALIVAVMTARWLARPARWHQARWSLALLAVAAIIADTPSLTIAPRSELPAFITSGAYRHYLTQGEIVVVISKTGNAGMLWQAQTDFYVRLAGGFISQMITPGTDLPNAVQGLHRGTPAAIREFRAFIARARVGAILVDTSEPRWVRMLPKLGLDGHQILGVTVYQTQGG